MGRRREKSGLERVVDGMATRLRFHKARRPETWAGWGSSATLWYGVAVQSVPLVAGSVVVGATAGFLLFRRRLGGGTASELVVRSLPEAAIESARRGLRRGTYDAEVGPEARAILERCAASYLAAVAEAVQAHFGNGGRPIVRETFRPVSDALEDRMRAALLRARVATALGRPPDGAALADLRGIEAHLADLAGEAGALGWEFRNAQGTPEDAHLAAERAEARRELDQGA